MSSIGSKLAGASRRVRRASSAQISTAVALIALLAGLAYNSYSMRAQTRQSTRQTQEAQETRISSEVALLSQLNQTFNELDQELGETRVDDWLCDENHGKRSLPPKDELVLYRALDYYDWLAWLFNNGRIKFAAARDYWETKMFEALQFGNWFFPEQAIASDFPELVSLRKATSPVADKCPTFPP